MGNPVAKQAGIDLRNRLVEMVTANVDNGGDGMTRAELAAEVGISGPKILKHINMLIEDGRVEQTGTKIVPTHTGHIHVCRTCGVTMHTH
jgi:predicted ArsR family transcriptional regulator